MSKAKNASHKSSTSAARASKRVNAKHGAKKSMRRAMARGQIAQVRDALDSEFMALRKIDEKPVEPKQTAVPQHSMDDLASIMGGL